MPEYDSGIVEPKSTVLPITLHLNYKRLVVTLNFYYLSYYKYVIEKYLNLDTSNPRTFYNRNYFIIFINQ